MLGKISIVGYKLFPQRSCRVCSGALWILQFIAILYEPEHEITVLSGCRAMKAQISLGKWACSSESHQKTRMK